MIYNLSLTFGPVQCACSPPEEKVRRKPRGIWCGSVVACHRTPIALQYDPERAFLWNYTYTLFAAIRHRMWGVSQKSQTQKHLVPPVEHWRRYFEAVSAPDNRWLLRVYLFLFVLYNRSYFNCLMCFFSFSGESNSWQMLYISSHDICPRFVVEKATFSLLSVPNSLNVN